MELSKNVLDGISLAGSPSEIPDSLYTSLLNEVFQIAVANPIIKGSEKRFEKHVEKTAFSCLLSLVLEAAKHDADSTSISTVLEECRMDSNRISLFLNKFQENKEQIEHQLSTIGRSFDRVIDVKWRQDYLIKSSNCEKICEPSYIISLKTWNPHINAQDDVTFSCTMEQLQDLVLKLKDATKCIERNAV